MISNVSVPPLPAGITLIIVATDFPFRERELKHPLTIWLPLAHFYRCMTGGNGGLKYLLETGDICQVFLWIPATRAKFQEYEGYLRSQGLTQIYRVTEDQLHRWVRRLPEDSPVVTKKKPSQEAVMNGKTLPPPGGALGRILVVGFSKSDFPRYANDLRIHWIPPQDVGMREMKDLIRIGMLPKSRTPTPFGIMG